METSKNGNFPNCSHSLLQKFKIPLFNRNQRDMLFVVNFRALNHEVLSVANFTIFRDCYTNRKELGQYLF